MKATISLDGILAFLRSLSLSASHKEWLGQKLIEDAHREKAAAKGESHEDFINCMCGAWDDDPRTAEEITADIRRSRSDFFAWQAKQEIDRLWQSGELNEEKVESFRHLHERKKEQPMDNDTKTSTFVANLGTDLGLPPDFDEREAYRQHLEDKYQ